MADTQASSINWFLPIATLLLGYLTKSISDWLDFRRTSKREREAREETRREKLFERREEFQRATLLELQEELVNLVRTASQMHIQDIKAYRETSTWKRQLFEDDLSEANRSAHARVAVLTVRVRDEAVRNLVAEINQGTLGLTLAQTREVAMVASIGMTTAFDKVQKRIGELLRELDDELQLQSSA
jgi:hypothetical protein